MYARVLGNCIRQGYYIWGCNTFAKKSSLNPSICYEREKFLKIRLLWATTSQVLIVLIFRNFSHLQHHVPIVYSMVWQWGHLFHPYLQIYFQVFMSKTGFHNMDITARNTIDNTSITPFAYSCLVHFWITVLNILTLDTHALRSLWKRKSTENCLF